MVNLNEENSVEEVSMKVVGVMWMSTYLDVKWCKSGREGGCNLGGERLHGCHVDDFEVALCLACPSAATVERMCTERSELLAKFSQDAEECHVGFAGARGCAHEQILVRLGGRLVDYALDRVQALQAGEHLL